MASASLKVVGKNPNSGGGIVVVAAEDENGALLLDLASGKYESVPKGEKSKILVPDDNDTDSGSGGNES